MKSVRYKPAQKKVPVKVQSTARDPVKVFCRIRPLRNDEKSCVKVTSQTTVSLQPPAAGSSHHMVNYKEIRHTFKHVFDDKATQKQVFDHVALPLIDNLIHGKNGLLFTYGVSGSGKTYTMTGEPQDGGIMPRCLDVIFNSVFSYQAMKFVFKPDRMNGFDIQSEADAMIDVQNELHSARSLKIQRKKEFDTDLNQRIPDDTKVGSIVEDNTYAVFVTYVEIYNNAVYDLLEEIPEDIIRSKQLQVKIVREDARHNMYVHSVTQVEIKSTEEAFEAFYKGQKRKRMAITILNSESSRSHSVFTIRLVQAPLDSQGENVLQDGKAACISQLSLVDLAGSERTNRTKNSGQRLREAGNINNSLMTLRTCLEILRENQLHGVNKMVPYRDSKMTLLFKNFFDGEGQVQVIVCLNPSVEDYDETVHVMKFAEITQEVQVSQPSDIKLDFGLTPGRRKANRVLKQVLQMMEENGHGESKINEADIDLVYSLGPPFPCLDMSDPSRDMLIKDLTTFLELRVKRRSLLHKDWQQKCQDFHSKILEVEKEKLLAEKEHSSLQKLLDRERSKVSALENRLVSYESELMYLQYQVKEKEAALVSLKQDLQNQEALLNEELLKKERLRKECSDAKDAKERLREQEVEFKLQMKKQEQKQRKVKRIFTKDTCSSSHAPLQRTRFFGITSQPPLVPETNIIHSHVVSSQCSEKEPSLRNPWHRRSRTAGDEIRLEHRLATAVGSNCSIVERYKSVAELTDTRHVANPKTSKDCLMTQEQDSSGELEPHLHKTDVHIFGDGEQVIFSDVETMKHKSPTAAPSRKRSASTGDLEDTEAAFVVSVEGHKRARH